MIDSWFRNKGSYQEGVQLLYQVCGANKRMYNRLVKAGETRSNMAALKYELTKYRYKEVKVTLPGKEKKPSKHNSVITTAIVEKRLQHSNTRITLADINDAHLQRRYIEKNQAFYKRWMLKKELNALAKDQEEEALTIIMEIMKLTKLIDTIWAEIDYFIAHKKRMPSAHDYEGKSLTELIKIRQRLYQKRTKRNRTLEKWNKDLSTVPKDKRIALQSKIDKQRDTITQINLDIATLTDLIDG